MALKKIIFEYEDSSLKCLDGKNLIHYETAIKELLSRTGGNYNPFVGIEFKDYAMEFKLQRAYFALLEEVAKEVGGYTKDSLHAALKPMLFSKIKDNLANFKDNVYEASTTKLTHAGWVSFIEQLKEFVSDIFGYVFK